LLAATGADRSGLDSPGSRSHLEKIIVSSMMEKQIQLPFLRSQFLLNPDITYLNFGSFGACPAPIFEDYQRWQRELEWEPVQFITANGLQYLQQSRETLAAYIHCGADDIVYTTNPSYAVNIIAKSFPLVPGDEILSTDLEYGACDRTWNYYCKKAGAKYIRQPITLPVVSKEKLIEDFFKGLTSRTKAIFISQITSATALVLPVKEICAIARQKGLITIVDGAHVPGHLSVDLSTLQADIYTGACHKWMLTPKGCSFLYVKSELQDLFDPLLISWGYESDSPSHSRFLDYHQLQGTRDFSAFLTVPRAIQFLQEHDWPAVKKTPCGFVLCSVPNHSRPSATNSSVRCSASLSIPPIPKNLNSAFSKPIGLKCR
jgi:isopenicillin-N epimerase